MNEWISVKDRLPERDILVKIKIEGKRRDFLATYYPNDTEEEIKENSGYQWEIRNCREEHFSSIKITHWMPLPEIIEGEWISIEDRLPEDEQNVLLCDAGQNTRLPFVGTYEDLPFAPGFYIPTIPYRMFVTHWMPLPDIPEYTEA
jgi:hypothetical protein